MGSPTLPGWVASGGDPCGEAWQGVSCDNMNNIVSVYGFCTFFFGKYLKLIYLFSKLCSLAENSMVLIWEENWVIT